MILAANEPSASITARLPTTRTVTVTVGIVPRAPPRRPDGPGCETVGSTRVPQYAQKPAVSGIVLLQLGHFIFRSSQEGRPAARLSNLSVLSNPQTI